MSIFHYNTPLVSIKEGNGNIICGSFNLIHQIDLGLYEDILSRIQLETKDIGSTSILKPQLAYQIGEISKLLGELRNHNQKTKRSINWIGSAWKWIAGSPDATDWDTILTSQNKIIENNNEQYKINKAITERIQQILKQHNEIQLHLEGKTEEVFQQTLFNRLQLLKEEVKEVVRAAQLAKGGIVNSNLMDRKEISRLINEIETLPYYNEIEAIEHAEPTMLIKDMIILYVISLPKTTGEEFHHLKLRSTIKNNQQIHLEYSEILINQRKIYGMINKCQSRREVTICRLNQIQELKEDHCINQLMKGFNAGCEFLFNEKEVIEPINDNTIFLNNFNGTIMQNGSDKQLEGNFLIQYQNETLEIKGWTFTNREIKTSQILPPMLQTNITRSGVKLNLEYLHNLQQKNIGQIDKLAVDHQLNNATDIGIILTIIISVIFFIARAEYAKRKKVIWFPKEGNTIQTTTPSGIQPIQLNF